jgi:hypothetical protein
MHLIFDWPKSSVLMIGVARATFGALTRMVERKLHDIDF